MESNNARDAVRADSALHIARKFSRWAQRLIEAEPQFADAACERPFGGAEMRTFLAEQRGAGETALRRALRMLRKRVMLRLMARDLAGRADLAEVLATTTGLAETAIAFALAGLDAELSGQHGHPRGESGEIQQLHVVGMGKLGGGELNVSSDVDLIFVYPQEGETDGAQPLSNHEYFTRLGRRLIGALNEVTEDG
jgi:glutamate-ammonia-ligase adenylyltransferase